MPDQAQMAPEARATPATQPPAVDHYVFRGVLIFIVLLDHNDVVRNVRAVDAWFLPMTFHVAGFLLLPFLTPPRRLSVAMARDHAVRYLVPFAAAVLAYAAAYQVAILRRLPDLAQAGRVARALLLADPGSLGTATGFIVLWFLPALLCVVLLSAAYTRAPRWRPALLCVSLIVHLGVGGLPQPVRFAVPQGLLIALYIFPLGLLVRRLLPPLAARCGAWLVPVSAVLLLACWRFELGHEVEVATLVVPTWRQPLWVLATDCSDIAFLLLLAGSARALAHIPGLRLLGRHSLLVYLIHPPLYKPVLAIALLVCTPALLAVPALYWSGAAATVLVAGGASLLLAVLIESRPGLTSLVMPRTLRDWAPVRWAART